MKCFIESDERNTGRKVGKIPVIRYDGGTGNVIV